MYDDAHSPVRPPSVTPNERGLEGGLYTPAQRARRDETVWTLVQGVLAPLQFLICAISIALIVRYLVTGEGLVWAHGSVLVKTAILYVIMVTGAIWEKVVFGQYLFAPAFYWEDMVSMAVLALHTAYLVALFGELLSPFALMLLALAAYAAYVVNAVQFLLKLRAARLQHRSNDPPKELSSSSAEVVA
ncbi:MAG: 2-vinyl bacteriochlorophyllide hydratase [Pseudomonadota bacterium]